MACTTQTITIASPSTRAKELALSARKLLEDLKELEVGMTASNDWQQCPRRIPSLSPSNSRGRSLPRQSPSTASQHQIPFACKPLLNQSTSNILEESVDKKHVTGAFVTFCEHLLFMNHVWKQERQIRALQASIKEIEKAKCSNAFKSFCDRLLLSNRVWQLERQIQELVAEGERNKRARVAAITHAAKQMAVDVRKEAMIEEFVMELMQELQQGKQAVAGMKEGHEREIREIQGDWLKEYRRLARENELLRLERHARLAEQEVSNELEQSLYDSVERSQQRVRELEHGDGESTLVGDAFDEGSILFSGSSSSVDGTEIDDLTEVDEGMSTISSATYVSLQESSNWYEKSSNPARRQRQSISINHPYSKTLDTSIEKRSLSRRQSMPPRKLDTTPYAGFSFNPLFFGNPEMLVVSPSRDTEAPAKATLRPTPPSTAPVRERKDSTTKISRLVGPTGTRGPWRF
ncbi:hypothetical protein P691DRAFT_809059 [Macrolepiota fuliginosa MF-IS2]|uniref:Uncharacterized protein n=1 Tax=Macrolepiota fuliginosa MF-IS2 TaxID=1400762 RepID=A0A9P5X550_9AGAR|nr:hypothetical protein P691DRAFT_809059 [Macrolepiota fuliginosa MF-IS2]